MLIKAGFSRTVRGLSNRKKLYCIALVAFAAAIILGLGFSLQAGSDTDDPNHSGDLSYLLIKAEDARNIEYVVLEQPGVTCDAGLFADGGITADDGRIEAEIVEDPATVGLCVRADYGYGNYLYEKYGDDWSFIRIAPEERPADSDASPPVLGLRVSIGLGVPDQDVTISAEYVPLRHRSIACDAAVFANATPTAVFNNQLIHPGYDGPRNVGSDSEPVLCFRADYGSGNYVYAVNGIVENILFSGGTANSPTSDEVVFADLTAWAPTAEHLHYVVFIYPGKSCSARSFNIDADFIVFSPPEQPELFVEAEELEEIEALCFRADYGDGYYAYQKFGGRKIEIEPRYRLTLTAEKKSGQLRIYSNTNVSSWQLSRGDHMGRFFGGRSPFARCSPHVGHFISAADLPETSEYSEQEWAVNLRPEDYGRKYCIRAEDSRGSVAYLATAVLASDLSLEVIQEGDILKASINRPEEAVDWQAVKTSGECSHFSFIVRADIKEELSFGLTRRDHNRFYCFRVKDKYGGYVFRRSPIINTAVRPEIVSVEQLGDVVLAEAGEVLNKSLYRLEQWRIAKVDQAVCDEDAINEGTPRPIVLEDVSASQLAFLEADDVGHYLCFAIDYRGGFSRYRLSERITAFESRQTAEDLAVDIRQYGNYMIARANQPAFWFSFQVQDEAGCSQEGLLLHASGGGGEPRAQHYYSSRPLDDTDDGTYFCFRARFAEAGREDLYVTSSEIEGITKESSAFREYPYEAPETIDSGQDFADFLRPYLTDRGLEILDGLDGTFLYSPAASADVCGSASGCYHSWNKSIHLSWQVDYNDFSTPSKKRVFSSHLKTFIHEFMHATDYQDPSIENLSLRTWECFSESEDTSGFDTGIENSGVLGYVQCLDESHPLFRQLRGLYDDLPEELELDHTFSNYRWLTNINGRWGKSQQGSYSRLWNRWHTELYAQGVFIRHLPAGLEKHYSQYFKDRLDIVEIYESNL